MTDLSKAASKHCRKHMFDGRTPLVAGIAQNVVNLGLDLSLVLVAGWGVVGAAAAMTIAQYTGAASMIAMLILGKRLQVGALVFDAKYQHAN